MARIEKLQLQGIRSFGPRSEDRQTVEFFSPLTLILGQNGCGKTTIIECLKYVTTGDPPPGSTRGVSFVHDPKMARESTVRAQVKLLFKSIGKQDKIISRSLEATQQIKKISMKTMDTTITTKLGPKESTSISSKCADVDSDMLMALGVSKPILNYVIFCHQEDSNWPLEEGKKVKDKFDEIFNSAKYKNCLNSIKDVIKKLREDAKHKKTCMGFYKEDKETCFDKKEDKRKKMKELKRTEDEVDQILEELKPLEEELDKIMEEEKGFSHLHSKLTEAETKLKYSRRERTDLESKVSEIFPDSMSEADIKRKLSKCEGSEEENKIKLNQIKERVETLKQNERIIDHRIQKIVASLGRLFSDNSKNEKDEEERSALLSAAEEKFGININPENFEEALRREEEKILSKISKFKADRKEEEEKMNDGTDEIKQQRATLEEKKKRGLTDLMETKAKIAKIRRELSELEGAGDLLNQIKQDWEDKNKELERARDKVYLESLQRKIKESRSKIQVLEKREESLKEELVSLEEIQSTVQKLDYMKNDIKTKEEKRKRIVSKRNSTFLDLFKTVPEFKRLKEVYQDCVEKNEKAVNKNELLRQKIENSVSSKNETKVALKQERGKKLRKEKEYLSRIGETLVGDEDLESELLKTKDSLELLRKDLQVKEAGKFTYKELLDNLEKMSDPACPTCHRQFHEKIEAEELKADLKSLISEIPKKAHSLEKKVRKEEDRYENLQKISPDYYALKQVRQEITDKENQVKTLEEEVKELQKKKNMEEEGWTRDLEEREQLKSIAEDVQLLDNLTRELNVLNESRTDLQQSCPDYNTERGLELVRREEKQVSSELKQLRKECNKDQDEFNSHSKLMNELEASCNKLTNKKLEIEGKQQQRSNTLERKTEMEKRVVEIQQEIDQAKEELEPLRLSLEACEREKVKFQREKDGKLQVLQGEERYIQNQILDLNKLEKTISEFKKTNTQEKIEEKKAERLEQEAEQEQGRAEKALNEDELAKIHLEVGNQENIKRNLNDNIRLRKLKNEEDMHEGEIRKYKEGLANTDFAAVAERRKSLIKHKYSLDSAYSTNTGKIVEMKKVLKEVEKELNNPKLKDASRKYYISAVENSTTEMAIKDLNKYYTALDFAIMSFHKDKMRVVNSIIREMWRATYRGNDIDYIEIKTDDGDIQTGGAEKRKSYNYRVVMVKNEVEMDMRGRCSAGQKVLSCLIIRLALAETFAENCGIIALDEPTTNLDRENIESLALALSNIANRQSEFRDFQLVIITHDEDFIDELSRSCDKITHYQKVTRNSKGISEIRKHNVSNLQHSSQFG